MLALCGRMAGRLLSDEAPEMNRAEDYVEGQAGGIPMRAVDAEAKIQCSAGRFRL